MAESKDVVFRAYQLADYDAVASLWTRINRELAPVGMEEIFEQYIATTINGELKQLSEVFAAAKRNAFWVVEGDSGIVGSFGIESRTESDTELRRMYLDRSHRGLGIAQRMRDALARLTANEMEAREQVHGFGAEFVGAAQGFCNAQRTPRMADGVVESPDDVVRAGHPVLDAALAASVVQFTGKAADSFQVGKVLVEVIAVERNLGELERDRDPQLDRCVLPARRNQRVVW